MKSGKNFFNIAVIGLFLFAFSFSVVMAFFNTTASLIELAVTTVLFIAVIIFSKKLKKEAFSFFTNVEKRISPAQRESIDAIPYPACVTSAEGEILFYNSRFSIDVLSGQDAHGEFFKERFPFEEDTTDLVYKDRKYTVSPCPLDFSGSDYTVYYFVDDTELKNKAEEYERKKSSVVHILIDNYDELLGSINGSEKNFIASRIENILEKTFVTAGEGLLRKIEKDRFVAVIDNEHLDFLVRDKFSFLEQIRKATTSGHLFATLSVGIGRDCGDLKSSDITARQALDMALGRGGNQLAIKSEHGYEFFGGLSKGIEKRAKVRSRMIASALCELIEECDNVIIMGHKMADFDCVGAAVGLYKAVSMLSKPVHICLDREHNLSKELISNLCAEGYDGVFVSPAIIGDAVTKNTLLIVVDTHNPAIVEQPELLSLVKRTVVIDHHRMMVNHISNAVIFYHEPNASSTCEMVTELVQYIKDGVSLTRLEAEALLSGIMLDTKNFIIKSGVRTFEAAAYLRRLGADMVRVNEWFASSIETYHQRAALISSAEIISGCAISMQDEFTEEILLAAPQTADELLHIRDVSASFVMYKKNSVVFISARSFGKINVQLIMEKLGGGGHLTMAGAQVEAESCAEVKERLIDAIESYFKENDIKTGGK